MQEETLQEVPDSCAAWTMLPAAIPLGSPVLAGQVGLCAVQQPQGITLLLLPLLHFLRTPKLAGAQYGMERKEWFLYLVCGAIMPPPPRPSPILLVS